MITVLTPHEIRPVGIIWNNCPSNFFELIADEHDIAHVCCFTVNPCGHCKYPANIAKITLIQSTRSSKQCICTLEPRFNRLNWESTRVLLDIYLMGHTLVFFIWYTDYHIQRQSYYEMQWLFHLSYLFK